MVSVEQKIEHLADKITSFSVSSSLPKDESSNSSREVLTIPSAVPFSPLGREPRLLREFSSSLPLYKFECMGMVLLNILIQVSYFHV